MISSLFQIVIGLTGLLGILLRFIGPLTIAPTITLVGVALFKVAADQAGKYDMLSDLKSKVRLQPLKAYKDDNGIRR